MGRLLVSEAAEDVRRSTGVIAAVRKADTTPPAARVIHLGSGRGPEEQDDAARLLARTSARDLLERELPLEECLLGSLVTRQSRVFIVGATGAGKTMFGLAVAGGIASGRGFLNWRSSRSARVLYIDGEMALKTLQRRVRDLARRLDGPDALDMLHLVSWQDADTLGAGLWAPLNTEDGQSFTLRLCELLAPDVVVFDNVQALVAGDMKDEVPWAETWPLVAALTARNIGQIWIDHTGHNTTRQYGSSTKAWRFDTVGILTPLPREECAPGETAFTLSFDAPGKARNRSPETWNEYTAQAIRLRDDEWTTSATATDARPSSKLTSNEQIALRTLGGALKDHGTAATVRDDHGEALVVNEKLWRAAFYRQGMPAVSQDTKKRTFNRAVTSLLAKDRIARRDDFVWVKAT